MPLTTSLRQVVGRHLSNICWGLSGTCSSNSFILFLFWLLGCSMLINGSMPWLVRWVWASWCHGLDRNVLNEPLIQNGSVSHGSKDRLRWAAMSKQAVPPPEAEARDRAAMGTWIQAGLVQLHFPLMHQSNPRCVIWSALTDGSPALLSPAVLRVIESSAASCVWTVQTPRIQMNSTMLNNLRIVPGNDCWWICQRSAKYLLKYFSSERSAKYLLFFW